MNKKDIIVLAKKSKKREGIYYTTLYIDKRAVYNKKPFHVCKDFSYSKYNDDLITTEDFDYISLTTALISFYYSELEEIGIDKNVLAVFYSKLYKEYEENIQEDSQLKQDLLDKHKAEVELVEQLVLKWYNQDIRK